MIGDGGAAGSYQFGQADAGGDAEGLLIKSGAKAVGRGRQPVAEAEVKTARFPLEQLLKQMVMGVDPAGIGNAAPGVEDRIPGFGGEVADLDDAAAADADIASRGARRYPIAGHNGGAVFD